MQVEFEDDTLTLRGEKQEEKKEGNGDKKFHLYERTYGAFRRSFALPRIVNAEKITTEFKNGVLTITLPKTAQAKAKGRHIPSSPNRRERGCSRRRTAGSGGAS